MNDKKLIFLCISVLIIFFGTVIVTEYVNRTAYEDVLDPARAAILGDLKRNNITVLHKIPDWDNLRGMAIMTADSYSVFKARCLWDNSGPVYHDDMTGFFVVVSQYNQVWEYSIIISKNRQLPNPFFTYEWENYIG